MKDIKDTNKISYWGFGFNNDSCLCKTNPPPDNYKVWTKHINNYLKQWQVTRRRQTLEGFQYLKEEKRTV